MSEIMDSYMEDDALHEECGVFGVYDFDRKAVELRSQTQKDQRARCYLQREWDL
jgi:hypothetical protein